MLACRQNLVFVADVALSVWGDSRQLSLDRCRAATCGKGNAGSHAALTFVARQVWHSLSLRALRAAGLGKAIPWIHSLILSLLCHRSTLSDELGVSQPPLYIVS